MQYSMIGKLCFSVIYEPGIDVPLLPCPFCGSSDLEVENTHTPSYTVECACGAERSPQRTRAWTRAGHHSKRAPPRAGREGASER